MFFQKQKEKKSPFNFKPKKSQKNKDNNSQKLVVIIQTIIKKIGIIFNKVTSLTIFFLLVIVLAVIIAVWHFFHRDVYMGVLNPVLNNVVLQTNLTAGSFVTYVIEAMSAILYVVFIQPI